MIITAAYEEDEGGRGVNVQVREHAPYTDSPFYDTAEELLTWALFNRGTPLVEANEAPGPRKIVTEGIAVLVMLPELEPRSFAKKFARVIYLMAEGVRGILDAPPSNDIVTIAAEGWTMVYKCERVNGQTEEQIFTAIVDAIGRAFHTAMKVRESATSLNSERG